MARNAARPLSPHLTIWKWGPHMLVSILHRVTGTALALGGGVIFTWWLAAAATGPDAYQSFYAWVAHAEPGRAAQGIVNILAKLVALGLTWSFFQHMGTGIRHLVLDTGAGYELRANKTGAVATIAFSVIATLAVWAVILTRGAH